MRSHLARLDEYDEEFVAQRRLLEELMLEVCEIRKGKAGSCSGERNSDSSSTGGSAVMVDAPSCSRPSLR